MDITSMSPVTGRLVKEDGSIYNIADALSNGSEPVTSQKVPIHAMSPRTGRMVREDGTIVNVAELIEELLSSGGGGGTPGPAGVGISKIEKTGTDKLVDTYTITYTNGQTTTFTVTNGAKGDTGPQGPKGDPEITTKVDHNTSDTTFQLPPNEYHTWGEVSALTLTLGTETAGQANGYWFSFDSGATATTLSLPESINTDIVVEENTHYECVIVDNYMTFSEWGASV